MAAEELSLVDNEAFQKKILVVDDYPRLAR